MSSGLLIVVHPTDIGQGQPSEHLKSARAGMLKNISELPFRPVDTIILLEREEHRVPVALDRFIVRPGHLNVFTRCGESAGILGTSRRSRTVRETSLEYLACRHLTTAFLVGQYLDACVAEVAEELRKLHPPPERFVLLNCTIPRQSNTGRCRKAISSLLRANVIVRREWAAR